VSGATGIQKRRAHRSLHAMMPRWAACCLEKDRHGAPGGGSWGGERAVTVFGPPEDIAVKAAAPRSFH
jgi:hypothetical protein